MFYSLHCARGIVDSYSFFWFFCSLKRQVKNLQEQYKTRERQIATEKKATGLEIRLRQAKATQQVKLSQQQVLVVVGSTPDF